MFAADAHPNILIVFVPLFYNITNGRSGKITLVAAEHFGLIM